MIMKTLVSALIATSLVGAMALPADAAPKHRDRTKAYGYTGYGYTADPSATGCVVTGWTDWSLTRPIFKCSEDKAPANYGRRR